MRYKVGDRVRNVSEDHNAPVGIVGTIVSTKGETVPVGDGEFEFFQYIVKYDEGQHGLVDLFFPDGAPENDEDLEPLEEEH